MWSVSSCTAKALEPDGAREPSVVLSRLRARLMALLPSMVASDWSSQDYKEEAVVGGALARWGGARDTETGLKHRNRLGVKSV